MFSGKIMLHLSRKPIPYMSYLNDFSSSITFCLVLEFRYYLELNETCSAWNPISEKLVAKQT